MAPHAEPVVEKRDAGRVRLSMRTWPNPGSTKPPVILLHGTGATAEDWDEVAEHLRTDRTVIAVDLRGHGASDWPGRYSLRLMAQDVVSLLTGLDEPAIDLIGHSLGGLVACLVATTPTVTVRHVVLEDVGMPHPRQPAPPARPDGALSFDWAVVEQVRPEIDCPDPHWPETMAAIDVPTLVIGGGAASFVPQEHIAELAATIPRAASVTVDAGHLIHTAQPAQFLAQVVAFLDS